MIRITEAEVKEMFGSEGNWEDYWLGCPSQTNTFIADPDGWTPAENIIREMRQREGAIWHSDLDEIEALMEHEGRDRAGGILGLEGDYWTVLANVIRLGDRAIKEEERLTKFGSSKRGRL